MQYSKCICLCYLGTHIIYVIVSKKTSRLRDHLFVVKMFFFTDESVKIYLIQLMKHIILL